MATDIWGNPTGPTTYQPFRVQEPGQAAGWNPAAPPTPGEADWARSWQPGGRGPAWGSPGGWQAGADQSYRWYEPDVREFYEENPQQAYQGFLGFGFGNRERPLLDYARSQYSTNYAAALRGQESGGAPNQTVPPGTGAQWTDYLTPDLVYQLRQGFAMQTASNRGITNTFMPAGRWAGN